MRVGSPKQKGRRVSPDGLNAPSVVPTLTGVFPTSAPGAYLPAVSNSGTAAYRPSLQVMSRTEAMGCPITEGRIDSRAAPNAAQHRSLGVCG